MTRKILWMLLSFLLVAALVLSSCAKEEVVGEQEEEEEEVVGEEEEEEEEEVVVPPVGEPIYGGTVTFQTMRVAAEPPTWSQIRGAFQLSAWSSPVLEQLLIGDVETYGPRGTNEYAFQLKEYVPDRFLRGQLAESWEISTDPLGIIFHIRPGVMWQANPHIGFEPREYTAYDAAFWGNNRMEYTAVNYHLVSFMPKEGAFEALDRYTLFAHFDMYLSSWPLSFGYGYYAGHYPPETWEAGADDWRNQVGTGPFILTEYVVGSCAVYKPNPNWWDKEKIINGKKYDAPFIDELIFPVIVDESTRIAALRTGAIDIAHVVPMRFQGTLSSTCPELIMSKYSAAERAILSWNTYAAGPMQDKNIRRAMMIGTDFKALVKAVWTEADIQCSPFNPAMGVDLWTPIEDLPPSTKELFTYDPGKAAQMIVDAGYPDGLELEINFTQVRAGHPDAIAVLADMWAKIGVKLVPSAHDWATMQAMGGKPPVKDGSMGQTANCSTVARLDEDRVKYWQFYYDDEWYNEMVDKAAAEMDEVKRNALLKEIAIYRIDNAVTLPFGGPYRLVAWWPWVKNYYGETECGYTNYGPLVPTLWIDQDLKAEMGY